MVDAPENIVLHHLREIRTTLAGHSARFDRIDERFAQMDDRIDGRFAQIDERFTRIDERFTQVDLRFAHMDRRFDRLERRFDDLKDVVSHTFALSSTNLVKSQELDQLRQAEARERQHTNARVDDLERRMVEVEKKIET